MQPQPEKYTFDFDNETAEIVVEERDELNVKIGEFAGPLDLLLYLIRQEQANIFDIPIAKITDEYLKFVRLMKKLDIAIAAEFLVMAAQLIEIKSRMLLPRDPTAEDDDEIEDPRKELVDRLLEYEKYKAAAEILYEKSTVEQAVFARGKIDSDDNNAEISATVFDLLTVFEKVLARRKEEVKLEIHREEISLAEMIRRLRKRLQDDGEISVVAVFTEMETKREMVTAFVAILEIVRSEGVLLIQRATFGDITLRTVRS